MYINQNLKEFKKYIKGKYVAVMGMGVSNTPLIKYLMDLDANITVFDEKTEDDLGKAICEEYMLQGVKFSLGKSYLDNLIGYDIIFRTPGMRPDIPEIEKELNRGAILTSEIEMLIDLCPGKIIGVTGSDGKTTTTTLIYNILVEEGYKCYLGGNIGIPLFTKIDDIRPEDIIVLELSSFQLLTLKKSPNVSVITNISPNHLDIHKGYEEYINSKRNIYKYQTTDDILVLNYDNDITNKFAEDTNSKIRFFSTNTRLDDGVILDQDIIKISEGRVRKQIIDPKDILIVGKHNIENACAAIAATYDMVKIETIIKVLKEFKGVEHRNEYIGEINGARWYNDSIGTSPTRTIAGLVSFNSKVILIAGGYDKHIDYTELGKYIVEYVKVLILLGETKDKIKEATAKALNESDKNTELTVIECKSLEEAVEAAYKYANKGDIVFFSPASASFDMFKNFAQRGNRFKELVNNL